MQGEVIRLMVLGPSPSQQRTVVLAQLWEARELHTQIDLSSSLLGKGKEKWKGDIEKFCLDRL